MAWATGTATGHTDLFDKLLAFLTTDPALAAAGQAWSVAWQHAAGRRSGVVVAGPGLAEGDRVLVGLQLVEGLTPESNWITVWGMSGLIGSTTELRGHVNVSPTRTRMFLDRGPMTYWFIANGRRFIVIAKISTVYESLYAGFYLPYATPAQAPYPFYIGGSAGDGTHDPDSWRSLSQFHRSFARSAESHSQATDACAWVFDPAGAWQKVIGSTEPLNNRAPVMLHPHVRPSTFMAYSQYPYTPPNNGGPLADEACSHMGFTLGDSARVLTPLTLIRDNPQESVYGILDGAYAVGGVQNAAENIVTVNGVDHLVVADAFRAAVNAYFAVGLE